MTVAAPEVFTVNEAAEYLRVSKSSAYRMIRTGLMPHVLIGRRIVIPAAALREWANDTALASVDGSDGPRFTPTDAPTPQREQAGVGRGMAGHPSMNVERTPTRSV